MPAMQKPNWTVKLETQRRILPHPTHPQYFTSYLFPFMNFLLCINPTRKWAVPSQHKAEYTVAGISKVEHHFSWIRKRDCLPLNLESLLRAVVGAAFQSALLKWFCFYNGLVFSVSWTLAFTELSSVLSSRKLTLQSGRWCSGLNSH